ncbi:hypothetical protein NGM10_09515 [Halorussus salilacus]|uniref:DUF7521 family protein n=1 Tax=Halorussus salilacus TaxID=2953750 RepID=UPI00209F6732|nr:hypothetical protein [Halorussus salilacus]USZ66969.1 hypothetical protein NGM10_09515 [Halorussus salilacus]
MADLSTLLLAFDALVVALGVAVAWLAFGAFRRTGLQGLRLVAFAVALVALGAVLPGVTYLATGASPVASMLAGSVVTTVGFVALSYSLYAEYSDDPPAPGRNAG